VITVTFGAVYWRGEIAFNTLLVLVGSNYAFKALCALADTLPLYLLVRWLRSYLELGPNDYAVTVTDLETTS
jgi:uncharacterized PurR-regulated membrane protein YhhQ (DUF165 family)